MNRIDDKLTSICPLKKDRVGAKFVILDVSPQSAQNAMVIMNQEHTLHLVNYLVVLISSSELNVNYSVFCDECPQYKLATEHYHNHIDYGY
ncbi:hypothetical protein DERF_011187 [Dermatophagoides farinae]|uniref:Uncharacterized protein n=1 Tax=Dermatophagoides farinae TaxID=6954 RepID=A0A922L2V0_DERFA|nr:hypothetical protein DERF_011187 [Dermatophagoides farinae]